MATVVRREIRKRGFFGWLFLILFVLFNAFMLWAVVAGINDMASLPAETGAEQAGKAIGGAIGFAMLMLVWVAGAVILGLFALLTRGRKTIVEDLS